MKISRDAASGKAVLSFVLPFRHTPAFLESGAGQSRHWKEKVLHARIEIGTAVLMGADIPNAGPMRSAYLTLTLDREEDAERVHALLADGGQFFMKMEKTPFANRFAMLRDRFGTSWMLLHQPEFS